MPDAPRIPQGPHPTEFDWGVMGEDVPKPISKLKPTFYSENNISSILAKAAPSGPAKLSQQNSLESSPRNNGNLSARSMQDNLDNTSEPEMVLATPDTALKTNGILDDNDNENISAEEEAVLAAIHHPKLYAKKKSEKLVKAPAQPVQPPTHVDKEVINGNEASSEMGELNSLDRPLTPLENGVNSHHHETTLKSLGVVSFVVFPIL